MRKIPLVLGLVLLMTGTAIAAQPLADSQLDRVTAGFATADNGPPIVGIPFIPFPCASLGCGPPPPPPNAPPSAQISYISFVFSLSGVGFQVPLVRP